MNTSDYHMSEYVPEFFKTIRYFSGFTGSLATLIVDKETLELKQWDVLDVQGIKSTVSLFDIKQNIPIDKKVFLFSNPYKE